jgi:pimeloyl-ACP methyl ester carboxylesterase
MSTASWAESQNPGVVPRAAPSLRAISVEAPDKEPMWFKRSGHMLPAEEPERFNDEVREIARWVGLF